MRQPLGAVASRGVLTRLGWRTDAFGAGRSLTAAAPGRKTCRDFGSLKPLPRAAANKSAPPSLLDQRRAVTLHPTA